MPRLVRPAAVTSPTSSPSNSIVPDVWGMSPEMTLNSVVFPAPLGPRMARLSPGAEAGAAAGTATRAPEPPSAPATGPPDPPPDPPQAEDRAGMLGGDALHCLLAPDDLHRRRLAEPREALLLTAGEVAPRSRSRAAERAAERLVDVGDARHRLDRQLAVLHVELLVVDREDGLTVLVELDRAVRRRQLRLGQRGLELGLILDVALDRLEALDEAPGVQVLAVRERARRGRGRILAGRDDLEPLADDVRGVVLGRRGVEVAGRARAADVGPRDARAELLELTRGAPEQVADELLGLDRALGLLVGLQERDQARATHGHEGAVDVGRHLLGIGRVVGRVQRREDPLGDLTAGRAELRDEAGRRRPGEAVVVGDDRGLLPPERVVGDVTKASVPLGAVPVEAEEVRRLHLERRVLRARGAIDEGLVGMLLGVVGHGDRLVTGQRSDHDVGVQLLHQTPDFLDR